jgi:hypothetical protein
VIADSTRDVQERRSALEQAALRRIATLVAEGAAPAEIFAAVSAEVDRVFGPELRARQRADRRYLNARCLDNRMIMVASLRYLQGAR